LGQYQYLPHFEDGYTIGEWLKDEFCTGVRVPGIVKGGSEAISTIEIWCMSTKIV